MRLFICRAKNYGGIITYMYNLLECLEVNEKDALLVSPDISLDILKNIKAKFSINIMYFKENKKGSNFYINRLKENIFIKRLIKNNKITKLFFVDWNFFLDWYVYLPYKTISFVHTYPTTKLPFPFKIVANNINKKNLIITVSNFSANKLKEMNYLNDAKVLYSPSNLEGIKQPYKELHRDDYFYIVTIAHLREYKNPELWLDIAKKATSINDNLVFNWYGSGDQNYENEFIQSVSENERINFCGYTNNVAEILENSTTIYIQTSKVESLGLSILDAINYANPIIVSENGGMPEIVENKKNGYVCRNSNEFVEAILNILSDENVYLKFSKESKNIYEKKFNMKLWEENLRKILSENNYE